MVSQLNLEAVLGLFLALVYFLVSKRVKDPFIDEIFHLRQCINYCHHKWAWDDKITTPPGLYVLGYLYAKALSLVGAQDLCSNFDVLRSLNLVGGALVMPRMLQRFGPNCWPVNITSLPLLFTYYFLFYTDVWSTVLVVTTLAFVQNPSPANCAWGGLTAFASLWFRQTNIVWIFFTTVVLMEKKVGIGRNFCWSDIQKLIVGCWDHWLVLAPFAANAVLFAAFLAANGGITFGDKENHQVQLHVVQVFYCFLFVTAFTWPVWLSRNHLKRYFRFAVADHYGLNLVLTAASLAAIIKIIENFTVVHPFLLADNRHYTFYLWRRVLLHNNSRYLMAPIYHFCSWNVALALRSSKNKPAMGWMAVTAYFVSICATVIPSPLFEPRYYIVPLVLFKMYSHPDCDGDGEHEHLSPEKRDTLDKTSPEEVENSTEATEYQRRQLLDFVWLNGINALTMAVFFGYEFSWTGEPGSIQRIIW